MKPTSLPQCIIFAALAISGLAAAGCRPSKVPVEPLPPAYTSNQITDPALLQVAAGIDRWGLQQVGAEGKPLYSRVEILRPAPTVQPYGVGVFQEEVRLPVIFTTGPGWASLKPAKKQAAVAEAFNHITDALKALDKKPVLQTTLTVQTPQGMELAWINRLDPGGKDVHGDD